MENYFRKYAHLLVHYCLKLKKGQPLLISGDVMNHDFIEIVKEISEEQGGVVTVLETDWQEKREFLLHHTLEECFESPLFDRHLFNEISLSHGAILMLSSPVPNCNEGVNPVLLHDLSKWLEKQIAVFRDKQMKGEVPWCIAAVANPFWAKKIMPNSGKPLDDLWQLIFDICFVTCENPESEWEHYLHCLEERGNILNQMYIKSLHYKSSNGTDLTIELPENYVFASANMGSNVVNMPSLEIFTTPKSKSTEGIVYATKPLVYQSVFISNFWLKFKNGKVIDYGAEEGFDMLREIVETDEGSHFLGEVALVDYDSRINQSGIIFENTLYDENASCHLALGRGFPECFLDGLQKSVADLQEMGMNYSETHVDFMIGARDLEIVACLRDGTEIVLMKQGKLIF